MATQSSTEKYKLTHTGHEVDEAVDRISSISREWATERTTNTASVNTAIARVDKAIADLAEAEITGGMNGAIIPLGDTISGMEATTVSAAIRELQESKAPDYEFDAEPTAGSDNLLTSGAIKSTLDTTLGNINSLLGTI